MDGITEKEHGVLQYRLKELEDWKKEQVEWRRKVDADRGSLSYIREDVKHLTDAFDGLRKTLLGFAMVVAAAAISFALTVLAATGRI